jgi:hypothetical protein
MDTEPVSMENAQAPAAAKVMLYLQDSVLIS